MFFVELFLEKSSCWQRALPRDFKKKRKEMSLVLGLVDPAQPVLFLGLSLGSSDCS
jgi:hypothetical protein